MGWYLDWLADDFDLIVYNLMIILYIVDYGADVTVVDSCGAGFNQACVNQPVIDNQ